MGRGIRQLPSASTIAEIYKEGGREGRERERERERELKENRKVSANLNKLAEFLELFLNSFKISQTPYFLLLSIISVVPQIPDPT